MGRTAPVVSWSIGPVESRTVRLLFALSDTLLGAGLVALLAASVHAASELAAGDLTGIAVGAWLVAALSYVQLGRSLVAPATGPAGLAGADVEREWHAIRPRVPVLGGAVLAATASLAAVAGPARGGPVVLGGTALPIEPSSAGTLAFLSVALWFAGVLVRGPAWFLSSSGRLDPERATLTYDGRREVSLADLRAARYLRIGDRAILVLRFERGHDAAVQTTWVVPVGVVPRTWPLFRAGVHDDLVVLAENRGRSHTR
jgi:hypothetical protein